MSTPGIDGSTPIELLTPRPRAPNPRGAPPHAASKTPLDALRPQRSDPRGVGKARRDWRASCCGASGHPRTAPWLPLAPEPPWQLKGKLPRNVLYIVGEKRVAAASRVSAVPPSRGPCDGAAATPRGSPPARPTSTLTRRPTSPCFCTMMPRMSGCSVPRVGAASVARSDRHPARPTRSWRRCAGWRHGQVRSTRTAAVVPIDGRRCRQILRYASGRRIRRTPPSSRSAR